MNICNVLPAQSGTIPPAQTKTGKNAKNTAGTTAETANSTDNNGDLTQKMSSKKQNQNFDQTLRKKIESGASQNKAVDSKSKNQQDPEVDTPDGASVLAVPLPAGVPSVQPVATEDASLLELSANAAVTEEHSESQSTQPKAINEVITTQALQTDQATSIDIDNGQATTAGNSVTVTNPTTPQPTPEVAQEPTSKTISLPVPEPTTVLAANDPTVQIVSEPIHQLIQTASDFEPPAGKPEQKRGYQPRQDTFQVNPPALQSAEEPAKVSVADTKVRPALSSFDSPVVAEKSERQLVAEFSDKAHTPSAPPPKNSPMPQNVEITAPFKNFSDFAAGSPQPQPQRKPIFGQETLPTDKATPPVLSQNTAVNTENPVAQFFARKINLPQNQFIASQTAARKNPLPLTDGIKIESEGQFSAGTANPSTIHEQSPLSTAPAKGLSDTNPGLHIGRQIQESISSSYRPGTQQIIIRLDPPELGRIMIKFIERPEGITGLLQVDKQSTHNEIQQSLPGIIQSLQNADVQIKKLEVVLDNQLDYNTPQDQSTGNNSNFGQQNPSNPHSVGHASSYNDWLDSQINPTGNAHPHAVLTDKSINLLI